MNLNQGDKPLFRDAHSDDIIFADAQSKNTMIHKPGAMWIPATGLNEWDGHVFISGATGSGKSYLINKILDKDNYKEKRERIMFSDLKEKDPSITSKYKKFGVDRGVDNGYVAGNLDKSMFVFDDVTNPDVIQFRDHLLEKGRHRKATVVAVNHRLRDGNITKKPINESRYIVTFPSSNRGAVAAFMRNFMEMEPNKRREALTRSTKEGRHLIFHMHQPNAIATAESAWLI